MALIDSKFNNLGAKDIAKVLGSKDRKVNALSFSNCYMSPKQIRILSYGIEMNKTLVKLDLSNNAMTSYSGSILI